MSGLRFGLSLSMQGRGGKAWKPSDLFETGNGFLYDFSRADTLFQEATGITPAAVDQNVGLALDISKWGGKTLVQVLAVQPELRDGGTTGVVGSATAASYNAGSGAGTITRVDVSNQSYVDFNSSANKWYFVDIQNGGPASLVIKDTPGGAVLMSVTSGSRLSGYVRPSTKLVIASSAGTVNFTLHSVKEIPGNHASQATSGARPVLKAGGFTRYDGSDDGLVMTVNPSAATTFLVKGKLPSSNSLYFGGVNGAGTSRLYLGTNSDVLAALVGSGTALLGTAALSESGVFGVMNDGTTASLIQNGAIVASQAQAGAPTTAFPIALGFVNNSGTPAGWGNSDIYKALAINRALTLAEIVKLTNYWMSH